MWKFASHVAEFVLWIALMHVRSADGAGIRDLDSRLFLYGAQLGIFVVTMRGYGDLLHSTCIDNRDLEGLIHDSPEPYEMKLCSDSLMICVGDYVSYQGITDLRKVVRHTSVERLEKNKKRPSRGERKERKSVAEAS